MANDQIIIDLVAKVDKAEAAIAGFRKSTEDHLGGLRLSAAAFFGAFGAELATKGLALISDGFGKLKEVMSESIVLAAKNEVEVSKLNTALAIYGKFTRENSADLQKYAETMQRKVGIDSTAIVSNLSLLESLTGLDKEGLKRAQTAAIDLAATLRVDLTTATEMVGRAFIGNITTFQRHGIAIRQGNSDAETFANTLKVIEGMSGTAAAQMNTYNGRLTQLSSSFEDAEKNMGKVVTENPAVLAAISGLSKVFDTLGEEIEKNKVFLQGLVRDGITALISVIPSLITPLQVLNVLFGTGQIIVEAYSVAIHTLLTPVSALIAGLGFLGEKLGLISKQTEESSQAFLKWNLEVIGNSKKAIEEDVANTKKREENLASLKKAVQSTADVQIATINKVNLADDKATKQVIKNGEERTAKSTAQARKDQSLEKQTQDDFAKMYSDAQANKLAATQSSLQAISSLMQSHNATLFRIGQAAALSNAIVNIAEGVTKAWAVGGPFGAPLAALVALAGAVQIATISSQQPPSSAKDGLDFIPEDKMTWIASRGERVVGARLNEDLTKFLDTQKKMLQEPQQGNNIFHINVTGQVGKSDETSAAIAHAVTNAFKNLNISRGALIA